MKKRKLMVLCSIIMLVISLVGCQKTSKFTVGEWNQNIFENSWLNMKFDVPSDWGIASKDEIKALIGAGAEQMNIEGTSAEQLKAAVELKTIYSFVVSRPGLSVQLVYENLAMSIGGTKLNESEYLDEVLKLLLPLADLQYKLVKKSSAQIANKEFKVMELSAYEGKLSQEYYVYKIDNFMVCIITSFLPEMVAAKVDFINNIKVLK